MPVKIEMSVDSPRIILDEENSVFIIEGPSYPADAVETYEPVIEWIQNSFYQTEKPLTCIFKFKIISSASRKMVCEILLALEKILVKSNNISIHWYYEKYDEDMMEVGEDFADNIEIPFRFFQM
jgi:hypothetical protein